MRTWVAIVWSLATTPVVAATLSGSDAAWATFCLYEVGCALAAVCAGGSLGRRPRWRELLAPAGAGLVVVFGCGALASWIGLRPSSPGVWATWGLTPPGDRWLLLAYVGINPWIEEWFWRGTLLGLPIRRLLGAAGARALSLLGFVPFHLVFLVPSFGPVLGSVIGAGILMASAIWVGFRERQGHAWGAAASHCGADCGLVGLYLLLLRSSATAA